MLSFDGNGAGMELYISLLSMTEVDGFEDSLAYRKRGKWFKAKLPLFFDNYTCIFKLYRHTGVAPIHTKFSKAET